MKNHLDFRFYGRPHFHTIFMRWHFFVEQFDKFWLIDIRQTGDITKLHLSRWKYNQRQFPNRDKYLKAYTRTTHQKKGFKYSWKQV